MEKTKKKFYITTPIYYVNDKPHIGHAYTTIAADVLTRFFKKQGKDVFFLTGTDEHGINIARAAEKAGKNPQEFCDKNSELFKRAWKNLNIKYDYFIRTTDEHHEKTVKDFLKKLKQKDAVYEKEYTGLYCSGCEKFLTEKELIDGKCPDHKKEPEKISEKNWFFNLEKYLKQVESLIKKNKLILRPEYAKKETLGLFKQKLEDFSISRQKVKWGIELPFDKNQTVYVWVDALLNYISGDGSEKFKKYWEDGYVIHLLAKDILKFHAIYWPAMLNAVGHKTPDKEFIHGFFTINGQKMSKTLGNVIDPNNIVEKFGSDAARYLLLSQFPFGQDGDIKEEKFVEKYNADLANGLGNLVARVLTLVARNSIQYTRSSKIDSKILANIKKLKKDYKKLMQEFKLYETLDEVWKFISFCDLYIEKEKPWQLIKNHESRVKNYELEKILNNLLYCINEISDLVAPFLPETSKKIKEQLKSGKSIPLFPRI